MLDWDSDEGLQRRESLERTCSDGADTAVLDQPDDGVFDCEELAYPPDG